MVSLPCCRQRALDRIEQTLVAEDPGLGLRFAVFTKLTRHEAIPGTEQVAGRLPRLVRRAVILPLVVISWVTVLAAGGLIPSRQTCPSAPTRQPLACHQKAVPHAASPTGQLSKTKRVRTDRPQEPHLALP